jgi:hypothetical protein
LLPQRPGWPDNLLIFFFSGLQKLEQRAKTCIELRWEYVELIPSLVAVACFFPGRDKDLSAPPRTSTDVTRQSSAFHFVSALRVHPKFQVPTFNFLRFQAAKETDRQTTDKQMDTFFRYTNDIMYCGLVTVWFALLFLTQNSEYCFFHKLYLEYN